MRLVWSTDIHLNFVGIAQLTKFAGDIVAQKPDLVVLTGDLSEAPDLENHLRHLDILLKDIPVFFVCGNHDYYNGSIEAVRKVLRDKHTYPEVEKGHDRVGLSSRVPWWLGSSGFIRLTDKTALVGHDGWYDGLYADWMKSRVDLNDYYCITELSPAQCPVRQLRHDKIKALAQEAAEYVRTEMMAAFAAGHSTVYVATHVPPFRENACYNGKMSDDDWMPHFSSKVMGDMLMDVMMAHPEAHCTVLCGHSHGAAWHAPLSNLECHTGFARYRFPAYNDVFLIE